jgi:hypothetical protein
MEQTKILCFQKGNASLDTIIQRQNLSKDQANELNSVLDYFVNNSDKINWIDVEKFNRVSELYVSFKYGIEFYDIRLVNIGNEICFQASYRMFNNKEYDSDDEEDNKLTSYIFKPFKVLCPEKTPDGKKVLNLDMYFKFVHECITGEPPFYQKRK